MAVNDIFQGYDCETDGEITKKAKVPSGPILEIEGSVRFLSKGHFFYQQKGT